MEDEMEELNQSELGSIAFWNDRYREDIDHYMNNGDVGEIWFGENIAVRIVQWLDKYVGDDKSKSVLDVGCGNGMLLVELWRAGYTSLRGIDYSPEAVELAKEIARREECDIEYEVVDVLEGNRRFTVDVILDKGTYDAVSLSGNAKVDRTTYVGRMHEFLKDDGVLVITSCNWTEDELRRQFVDKFVYFATIPTPQFVFCGKVGNVVSSVVFKKKV